MGIYIYGHIAPHRISPEKWSKTYEDSLKIVKAGDLACFELYEKEGETYHSLVPSVDKNGQWIAIGDMHTGSCIETYSLCRDIGRYSLDKVPTQEYPVLDLLYSIRRGGDFDSDTTEYFFNKTQGKRPHMFLLAIACMIASDFPEAAAVTGDITHASCIRACELAEKVLGRKIDLPLQYDIPRLYKALTDAGYTGEELAKRFLYIYSGVKDESYCDFIKQKFTIKEEKPYFLEKHKTNSVWALAKEFLECGYDHTLDALCELVSERENAAEKLVNALVIGKVHIEKKSLYDFTENSQDNARPDDAEMLFARVMAALSGMQNRAIDTFITLDEQKKTLKKHFTNDDIDVLYDKAFSEDNPDQQIQKRVDRQYEKVAEMADKKPKEEYDIKDTSLLYFWDSPDDTISPRISGICKQITEAAWKFSGNQIANGRLDTPEKQFDYVKRSLKERFALPKEKIDYLHENKGNTEILRWYVGLFLIQLSDSEISDTVTAFLFNRPLFEHMIEKYFNKQQAENVQTE